MILLFVSYNLLFSSRKKEEYREKFYSLDFDESILDVDFKKHLLFENKTFIADFNNKLLEFGRRVALNYLSKDSNNVSRYGMVEATLKKKPLFMTKYEECSKMHFTWMCLEFCVLAFEIYMRAFLIEDDK